MKAGRWQTNGETIKIATDGRVLDGQHRLEAVVESEVPTEFLVAFNVPPESFVTIDTGRPRRAADVLSLAGENNTVQLGGALKMLLRFGKDGRMDRRDRGYTNAQVLDALEKHPGLRESIGPARPAFPILGAVLPIALHYLFTNSKSGSREEADRFFQQLGLGEGLNRRHSVYLLRERLMQTKRSAAALKRTEKILLTIKAWNRRNEPTGTLKVVEGEDVRIQ